MPARPYGVVRARWVTIRRLLALSCLVLLPVEAGAQSLAVELEGEWRARLGDDPAWSARDFDDSTWDAVQIPEVKGEGPRSGGIAWYRRTVRIAPATLERWRGVPVAIVLGGGGGTAFQVYADGERVGRAGVIEPEPKSAPVGPRVFDVPPHVLADGEVVLALRTWQYAAAVNFVDAGWRWEFRPYRLGPTELMQAAAESASWEHVVRVSSTVGLGIFIIGLAIFHLLLWGGRRELLAYFWYGVFLFFVGVGDVLYVRGEPMWPHYSLETSALVEPWIGAIAPIAGWEFTFAFFRIRRPPRISAAYYVIMFAVAASTTFMLSRLRAVLLPIAFVVACAPFIGLATRRAFAGDRPARVVFVGGVALFFGAGMTVLSQLGVVSPFWQWGPDPRFPFAPANFARLFFFGTVAYAVAVSFRAQLEALDRSHRASRRFVPDAFLRILGREEVPDVQRGDSVGRVMTVLFADIRHFTTLSEKLGPEETFAFMNDYHAIMGPLIAKHEGFINQYYGDGIMALFAEPTGAVEAARDMLDALDGFNDTHDPIAIGIGVHTGDVMLGTIGDEARLDTGVIGDAVNTASRIEALTKEHDTPLLVSEATRAAIDGDWLEVAVVTLRGKSAPITLFRPA